MHVRLNAAHERWAPGDADGDVGIEALKVVGPVQGRGVALASEEADPLPRRVLRLKLRE
jgi:hypothetical protein